MVKKKSAYISVESQPILFTCWGINKLNVTKQREDFMIMQNSTVICLVSAHILLEKKKIGEESVLAGEQSQFGVLA